MTDTNGLAAYKQAALFVLGAQRANATLLRLFTLP